jgi:hypothetical protein
MGGMLVIVAFGLVVVCAAMALMRDWHGIATRTYRNLINQPLIGGTYLAMGLSGYRLFAGTFLRLIGLAVLALAGWVAAGH